MRPAVLALILSTAAIVSPAWADTDLGEVCQADLARHCEGQTIGSEGAMRCLITHRAEVSKPCGQAVDQRREQALERVRASCSAEIANYCTDDNASGRAPFHCLRSHEAQLSATCKATLPRWAG